MKIVPKDSRYIPFTQQPYCCVPTSIQMIMYRHGIPLIPAEELGYHLGLTVPKNVKRYFWNPRTGKRGRTVLRPIAGYGTRLFEQNYNPNKIFKKLGIPLTLNLVSIQSFKNFTEFKEHFAKLNKQDFDVLMCFHHATLVNDPERDNGHVVVLDKIYLEKSKIRFVDAGRHSPKWRVVTMRKMYNAMKAHPNFTGGFWEFQRN